MYKKNKPSMIKIRYPGQRQKNTLLVLKRYFTMKSLILAQDER